MNEKCRSCEGSTQTTEYGTTVCRLCGVENFNTLLNISPANCTTYCVPLMSHTNYTRLKRFKKYLHRAGMCQSASTIPKDTWDYLLQGQPYRGPGQIVRRLKKAPRNIRKKCYDSLPLLVQNLCPHVNVPSLTRFDKQRAITAFKTLDAAYGDGEPFVSYLFALEFILELIGRSDVLPFINKISCKKRRSAYRCRLNKVFNSMPWNPGFLAGLSVYQPVVRNGCRPEL